MRKGQLFSTDMIISMTIFIMILISVVWIREMSFQKAVETEVQQEMGMVSGYALSALIGTTGYPDNWHEIDLQGFNTTSIKAIGLAEKDGMAGTISKDKTERMRYLASNGKYDDLKKMLGLFGPDYEFQLSTTSASGTIDAGIAPDPSSPEIIVRSRVGTIEGNPANITLIVWKKN